MFIDLARISKVPVFFHLNAKIACILIVNFYFAKIFTNFNKKLHKNWFTQQIGTKMLK